MRTPPPLLWRLGWLYVAAICFVTSCTLWHQNNWMSYGGTHDFLAILPLMLTGLGGVAALFSVFGARRFAAGIATTGLVVVLPMAINELAWNRDWLVFYPSRVWIYAGVLSALVATAMLKAK